MNVQSPSNDEQQEAGKLRVVLFDGVCNLCNASVQFIIRHDEQAKFRFASLDSEPANALLKGHSFAEKDLDSVVYLRGEKALVRSSAALYIAKDLGGVWSLFSIFLIVPRPVRDLVYDLIAKYRYRWFGKRDSCMMPSPELKARFL